MNIQDCDALESAEHYAGELCRVETSVGTFRVIVCSDRVQWIIQRLTSVAAGDAGGRWWSSDYAVTREALERLWRGHTAGPAPIELLNLPAHFIRGDQPCLGA